MYQAMTIVGYLGHDPELRYTPSGTAIANFNVATSEWRPGKDGKGGQAITTWFRVSVFGNQAEACNNHLVKGSLVLVDGSLRGDEGGNPRIWTRKDGTPGASFELTARNVRFLKGAKEIEAADDEALDEELPF